MNQVTESILPLLQEAWEVEVRPEEWFKMLADWDEGDVPVAFHEAARKIYVTIETYRELQEVLDDR